MHSNAKLAPGLAALLACFAAALPCAARAARPSDALNAVVVTGARPGVEAIGSVRTVTAKEIARRGAHTLDDAIRLLPGVNVRIGADGTPRIDLRGLVTRQVKLLVNGVPFNSTYDGQFDPTLIPVESIAEIKLTSGASSMLYGDGDLGGVIDVITKQGRGKAHVAGAGAEGGSGGAHRLWGSASGGTQNGNYFLSVSESARDGLTAAHDYPYASGKSGGLIANSDRRRRNFYGSFGYDPADALHLNFTATHASGSNGIPPSAITDRNDPFATRVRYERIDNIDGNTAQLSADYDPGGAWTARSWLYYDSLSEDENSYDNANYDSISDPALNTTFLTHNDTQISGLHLETRYSAESNGSLTLAADSREEHWNDGGVLHDVALTPGGGGGGGGGGGKGGGGGGATNTSYTTRSIADYRHVGVRWAAAEYSVSPLHHTGLTAGLSQYRQVRSDGRQDDASGFLLGAFYDVSAATRLRASLSRHIRFPSIQQLYDPTSGNTALDRESARNVEVGARQRISQSSEADVVAFDDDVRNYIEKDRFTNRFENFEHYRFSGIELSGHGQVGARLDVHLAYTYLLSQNLSAGAASGDLQYRPRNKASVSADYAFRAGISGRASLQYVGQQAYFSRTTPALEAQLPGYALVDLRFEKRIAGTHASLFAGADNLLDKEYQTSCGFPQAGRFVYAGIDYRL